MGRDRPGHQLNAAERLRVEGALDELLAQHDPAVDSPVAFLGAQFDHGLAWVHYPEGLGGLGVAADLQGVVHERLSAAGAPLQPTECLIGLGMAAPTLLAHAPRDLVQARLRPLFTGEEIWCQLFSEPGAGSDLAGLATSATRTEDGWVVSGQKVWTTFAHVARWGLLLARSDPDAPKHKGLTYFALDMTAPGVEVRPLYQLTGEAEFNEVFLDDVVVPDTQRLGPVGGGWGVAITTLMNERQAISALLPAHADDPIDAVVRLWRACPDKDPLLQDRLVRLWVRSRLAGLTNERASQSARDGNPGAEASIGKLDAAELQQDIAELGMDLLGDEGLEYPMGYARRRVTEHDWSMTDPRHRYLRTRANTIEGGTSEIMRNIIAERVLGLPGEPRSDRHLSWREVPRG